MRRGQLHGVLLFLNPTPPPSPRPLLVTIFSTYIYQEMIWHPTVATTADIFLCARYRLNRYPASGVWFSFVRARLYPGRHVLRFLGFSPLYFTSSRPGCVFTAGQERLDIRLRRRILRFYEKGCRFGSDWRFGLVTCGQASEQG